MNVTLSRRAAMLTVVGLSTWGGAHAFAQNPTCDKAYDSDQLVVDIQELEQAIIVIERDDAKRLAASIQDRIECVEQRLPLSFLGRAYRGLAGAFYVGGQEDRADRWFKTAIELDRTYRYGVEDLPSDHPVRDAYAARLQSSGSEPVRLEDKVFTEGDYFLDGRRLSRPMARPERYHIFQRQHEGKVKTWLIEGPSFPESVLVAAIGADEKDGKQKGRRGRTRFDVQVQEMGSSAMEVDRSSPPEQVPLIIGGAAGIATGIALYAGSGVSRRNFSSIRDDEERLAKSQRLTNRLVIASLASIAVGSGVMTYGIIIDDAGRPIGPRIDVRF